MIGFSPVAATIGGALIGLAAGLLWIVNGRIAGISGIAGGLLSTPRGDTAWRVLFLVGLPLGAVIGYRVDLWIEPARAAEQPALDLGTAGIAIAGLLVGIGTALARGCTSGHGVCGLARLSPRSFVAVIVFMLAAIATVFVMRHV